jgi:hypothetical protein
MVLGLIVRGRSVRRAHGRTPDHGCVASRSRDTHYASPRAAWPRVTSRPSIKEEDVDVLWRRCGWGRVRVGRTAKEFLKAGEELCTQRCPWRIRRTAVSERRKDTLATGGVDCRCLGFRPGPLRVVAAVPPALDDNKCLKHDLLPGSLEPIGRKYYIQVHKCQDAQESGASPGGHEVLGSYCMSP